MTTCTDPSCRLLAAQYLRKQCKQLLAQFPGIRQATDVESIHRARVASRRLRAALRIFGDCLPQGPLKGWMKQIRRVTRGLGEARDLDVQREYLVEVGTRLEEPAYFPGIARLLVRTDLRRDEVQRKVLKALRRLEKSQVLQEMRKALKLVSEKKNDEDPLQTPACFRMAERHIGDRLGEMLALEDSLEDPNDCQQHHALRIAAKRLRYTMEICRPVYGQRVDAALEATKQLQSLLGEVHDCDVWIEQLPRMLEEERQWIVECYGQARRLEWLRHGVDYLIQRRQHERQERFAELAQLWQDHARQGTWKKLAGLLQSIPAGEALSEGSATDEGAMERPTIVLHSDERPSASSPAASQGPSVPADRNGNSPPRPKLFDPPAANG